MWLGNNRLNRWDSVIAVRITTTARHVNLPEVVELMPADGLVGAVHCGTLAPIDKEDLIELAGALSRPTMTKVNAALAVTLGLTPQPV